MAIYTVFAFGSGESRVMKNKNIISQFSEACSSDHHVIDGPGFLGREVKVNVEHAVQELIDWLAKQTDEVININLSGYSRGAVTCIRIANRLKKYQMELEHREPSSDVFETALLKRLKTLNIHLFVIEPVAGMNDKRNKNVRVIPDNVKSYVSILQTDEMRRDFKAQDLSRIIIESPQITEVTMLPMYGNHSDTTKIKHDNMQSGAMLVWYALHAFLTKHGTSFHDAKIPDLITADSTARTLVEQKPSSRDLLKLFTLNHEERANYLASGKAMQLNDGLPLARKMRSLNKHLDFYVKNAAFFTNKLERELFKITYPKVFNYLFEQNQVDLRFIDQSGLEKKWVLPELAVLKRENQNLFVRLQQFHLIKSGEHLDLGEPTGLYCLEPCTALQQMFPQLVPAVVVENAAILNKLAQLEAELTRLTFRYEREKSMISIFSERAQAHLTKRLRNEVRAVVENTVGDSQMKYMKILDRVELDYKKLLQAGSNSHLSLMLEDLLIKHDRRYQKNKGSERDIVLAKLVHSCLSLIKEVVQSLGYLGSLAGIFPALGMMLQDFGRRCIDALECLNSNNPLRYIGVVLASCLAGIGFIIRHSFGITALSHFISSCIRVFRDEVVTAIGPLTLENLVP
ncbi:MAG: DUF5621 domain-containing protein [Legionellales bacterium]